MQGLESLNQFQNFVSSIGGLGRYEDTYMVHAAEGETVVPMEVLDRNPLLKERLFESMRDMGIEPERYIVGNNLNSLNPLTGQPEFFLKKIISQIRKAMPGESEKYLGAAVGALTGNPFYGAIAGGVGSGAGGALTGGLSGAALPGFSKLGGQAAGFTDYLKGMEPEKLWSKAGSYLVNPVNTMQDYIGDIKDTPLDSGFLGGMGNILKSGIGSLYRGGKTLARDILGGGTGLISNLLSGITGTGNKEERNKRLVDASLGEGTWDKLGVSGRLNALDKLGINAKGGGLGGMSLGKLASLFGL